MSPNVFLYFKNFCVNFGTYYDAQVSNFIVWVQLAFVRAMWILPSSLHLYVQLHKADD